jgi:hypothetical protein
MKNPLRQNMGMLDRMIRICMGIVLLVLGVIVAKGTIGLIFIIVSILLLMTGITGFCILYIPFRISTKPKRQSLPTSDQAN